MAALALTVAAFASAKNLQSTAINPIAAPIATPREGGFTLRNRVSWAGTNSSARKTMGTIASAAAAATNYQVLTIPKRTLLKSLVFLTPPGSTAATHAFSIASAHASGAKSGKWEIGVAAYKEASQKAASVKVDIDGLMASIAITKATGLISSAFGQAVGSLPLSMAINHTTSDKFEAITFPFGGFVTMNYKAGASALKSVDKSSTVLTGSKFTGVMEAMADCVYIPE
ncbi:hypothetical protein LCGC14_0864650 [marine sediment metagenome]|uniref:Uncharacterized protein n=1 Tax=marine sediment metagenome TaxID=412755 RepID=A0A0F9PBF4_9ZZZZ